MNHQSLLKIGVVGTLLTVVCCFTPALVVALGAMGLGAAVAWLDYALLPALAAFVGLTLFAWFKVRANRKPPIGN